MQSKQGGNKNQALKSRTVPEFFHCGDQFPCAFNIPSTYKALT